MAERSVYSFAIGMSVVLQMRRKTAYSIPRLYLRSLSNKRSEIDPRTSTEQGTSLLFEEGRIKE